MIPYVSKKKKNHTHTHTHKGKPDSQNLLELSHPLEVISQKPVECNDIRAEKICGQVNEPMKGRMKFDFIRILCT